MRRALSIVVLLAACQSPGAAPGPKVPASLKIDSCLVAPPVREVPSGAVFPPFDAKGLQGVLERRGTSFLACYRTFLATTPGVEGTLALAFTIRPDGHLADVAVTPEKPAFQPVADCVKARMTGWELPFADPEPRAATVSVHLLPRDEAPVTTPPPAPFN